MTTATDVAGRGTGSTARIVADRLAPLFGTAVVALFLGYAVKTGLPLPAALKGLVAIALTQVVPGLLLWRAVRPRRGWLLEDLVMGFGTGAALAVPVAVVAGLTRAHWLDWVVPGVVCATLLLIPRTRARIRSRECSPIPWPVHLFSAVAATAGFPQFVTWCRQNLLVWTQGFGTPHLDAYLHVAIAGEVLNRGPVAWPTVLGEDLGYHWFTHAWMAEVAGASGIGLDEISLRLLPAIIPLVIALAIASAALRLTGRARIACLAVLIAFIGGLANPFGTLGGSLPMGPDSPTLGMGAPSLLALVVLLAMHWRREVGGAAYAIIPLLAIVAAGTKGSTLPLVVAGLGLGLLAMLLWNRPLAKRVLLSLLVVSVCLVATVVVVFHGSTAGLTVGLTEAAGQSLLATVLGPNFTASLVPLALFSSVVGALARGAGLLPLIFARIHRADPVLWLLTGATIAGAGALAVFSHPGRSQYYFTRTAIPLAAIGSAWGLFFLLDALGPRRTVVLSAVGTLTGAALVFVPPLLWQGHVGGRPARPAPMYATAGVLLGAALAGTLLLVIMRRWPRWRSFLAVLAVALVSWSTVSAGVSLMTRRAGQGGTVAATFPLATSQDQIDAARWIRDHSGVDDLVMTNRHCIRPQDPFVDCDSRRWVVSAFSERQSLVEGWTATPKATQLAPEGRASITIAYWQPERLRLNDGFIAAPTPGAARELWTLGVRWVYVDVLRPHADTLEPYAVRRYTSRDALVYELLPPR